MSAVMAVTWLAPSLSAATVNMLFRLRGETTPPGDIIIVAIDDASLQQVGNWPWPRSVMASVLDRITDARPQAVGLDVIYAESSGTGDDQLLSEAIRRSGRVVLPAQLTEAQAASTDLRASSTWLQPLSEIKSAAAAIGHAHADPDVDGVLRTVQLSKADERGERLWAFGLETLRVAERIPAGEIAERKDSLRVGRYEIAIHDEAENSTLPDVTIIRPNEMFINYLGPPRTFSYYSIADVLHGTVPAEKFAGKIVLIGAVAQTMGDTRITPFISYGGTAQSGTGMPGVEVHANVIETIRRRAWLRPLSDLQGFGIALLLMIAAAAFVRLFDGWRAFITLSALLGLVITGSLYVFNHYFIIPPVVPMLTAFFSVVPLLLLNSSITASKDLDRKLESLTQIQKSFMSHKASVDSFSTPLSFLGSILRAETVALFQKTSSGQRLQLTACFGRKPGADEALPEIESRDGSDAIDGNSSSTLRMPLADDAERHGLRGLLLVKRPAGDPFSVSERKLASEFASGMVAELRAARRNARLENRSLPVSLPHNIIWKLRAVDEITAHLIARIGFMNRVFTSMTEGLLVADITGQVVFANPAAQQFWGFRDEPETDALTARSLTELFVERGIIDLEGLRQTMREAMSGRNVLMEVELLTREGRFYTLQFSAVMASESPSLELQTKAGDALETDGSLAQASESPGVIGLIVIITDITKRRELERVKAETLQLVSHELRTPLTSIQGLSDLLLKCPVSEDESQEMLGMIYSEAVRMNELIKRYLDVTRIESGAQSLIRKPVNANQLIKACARSLGQLAREKRIRINLRLDEPSPTLHGDAQLLTQALNNLLSNAVKYSPTDSEIELGCASDDGLVRIYVRDHGYGIPKESQERVFEKFYRLERDAQAEVVGTGLGLPLVKEIVERHGGQLTLESEADRGSTFTIHIPTQRIKN
jgi:signal transduction histidine kinase/CHASE2 domain-containing sensor protein